MEQQKQKWLIIECLNIFVGVTNDKDKHRKEKLTTQQIFVTFDEKKKKALVDNFLHFFSLACQSSF
jgi:hypothetical protein